MTGLYLVNVNSDPPSGCDNLKYLQAWPNVHLGDNKIKTKETPPQSRWSKEAEKQLAEQKQTNLKCGTFYSTGIFCKKVQWAKKREKERNRKEKEARGTVLHSKDLRDITQKIISLLFKS